MTNRQFYLLFLLMAVVFFSQCQKKIQEDPQPNTVAKFSIRYLENEQQLRGQVSFHESDSTENKTPIRIEGGASFIRSGMKERSLPGGTIRYESTLNGPIPFPLLFGFKLANDDKPREVSFKMSLIGDYSVKSASKKDGLRIELSTSINKEESLLLLFTDPNGEARTIIRPGPLKSKDLFIPSDALLHFIPGAYRIYLVKSKKTNTTQEGLDLQATIEYYSKELSFKLEE